MKKFINQKILFAFLLLVTIISCKKDKCELPTANFTYDSSHALLGDTISLVNNSVNATRYRWEISSASATPGYFLETDSTVCFEKSPHLIVLDAMTIKLTAANDCYAASNYSVNFINNTWAQKANFNGIATWGTVSFTIGNKGYVGTGSGLSGLTSEFWEWDQPTNTWTQKANFAGLPRDNAAGFAIGTKGYIGTGFGSSNYNDFWEWDQASNTWTQKANFIQPYREYAAGFTIGNKGYFAAGFDGNYDVSELFEYDPATDSWSQKNSVPASIGFETTAFSIGTKAYIATGGFTNVLWEWDQATDSWLQKANLPSTGRYGAVSFSINGFGYVGSGADVNNTPLTDFWKYDPALNTWTRKSNFAAGRAGSFYFSIGNKGYVRGNNIIGFWEFDPQF